MSYRDVIHLKIILRKIITIVMSSTKLSEALKGQKPGRGQNRQGQGVQIGGGLVNCKSNTWKKYVLKLSLHLSLHFLIQLSIQFCLFCVLFFSYVTPLLNYWLTINGLAQERQTTLRIFGKFGWKIEGQGWPPWVASFSSAFFRLFLQSWVWQKKSNRQKVLEKNSKTFFIYFFRQIPIFSMHTLANLFIFAPNINILYTIVWMCFSTQFFSTEFDFEVKNDPRWLIKKLLH